MSDEKKDDEKNEDEETKEEDEEEDEEGEESEEEEEEDDEEEEDEELYDRDTGQLYGEAEQTWSLVHFNDKKHMKYYKYAQDRTAKDIAELSRIRTWKCNIRSCKYTHEWTEGDQNDIFLKFFVSCNYVCRKISVRTQEKDPNTGKRLRKKVWKTAGTEGHMLVTDLHMDMAVYEEREYNGFEHKLVLKMSYFELYDKKIRIEIWDYHTLMPNERMGTVERSMVHVARDVLNQVWTCKEVTVQKKRKSQKDIGTVKFICELQEVLHFELQLQNWQGSLKTDIMQINDDSAKDEEQSRVVFMTYKIGGGFFRSKFPAWLTKKRMKSKESAVSYDFRKNVQQFEEFVYPHFRTSGKMMYTGTRTELEDELLQVKVFHKIFGKNLLVGKGYATLDGCAVGAALSTNISWGLRQRKKSPLLAGRVSGSMDVNCPLAPLWREYSQIGVAQPQELQVYKPFEYCYLCVRIVRAKDLRGVNDSGLSDPYVTVEWGDMCQQTAVRFDDCDPEFNETLYFRIKSRLPDIPQKDEFSEYPYITLNVWDYDPAGNSDNLGTARFYLHNITGPRPYKPYKKEDPLNHPKWKPSVPRKRVCKFRTRRYAPLREHTIMTRSYMQTTKLDGLPTHIESLLTVESWFHGPGYIGEDKKPKGTSTHATIKVEDEMSMRRAVDAQNAQNEAAKKNGTASNSVAPVSYRKAYHTENMKRSGDLVQLAHRKKDDEGNYVGHRVPAGLLYLDFYEMGQEARETPEEENLVVGFENYMKRQQFGRRFLQFDRGSTSNGVRGSNQYGQMVLMPKLLSAIVPPYDVVNDMERKYMICLDSMKPITSQKIARFVNAIEFEFIDEEVEHISSASPGSWCNPSYFLKSRKGDVRAHCLLQACLMIGLKVDAWVAIGEARLNDILGGKREGSHFWVLTRESTSKDSHKIGNFPDVKDKGAIKFWETTIGDNIVPLLPNRWEGRDDALAYRIATGKNVKVSRKKAVEDEGGSGLKLRRRKKQMAKDDGSEDDVLPEEEDMLVFMKSKSHTKRSDETVNPDSIFVHGSGLDGETWGKTDEKSILMNEAQDFEKKRQAANAAKSRAERELAAKRRAEKTPQFHDRKAWIEENDNYSEVKEHNDYPYLKLRAVFNNKQFMANVQSTDDPTLIGYDFQWANRGGWIPLIYDEPFEAPTKVKIEPSFQPVALSSKMSDESLALLQSEIFTNLEAAITNLRFANNLETNWSAKNNIKPLLTKVLDAKHNKELVPKVESTGWVHTEPGDKKKGKWEQAVGRQIEEYNSSLGFYWSHQYKVFKKQLFQSVPPGYVGRLFTLKSGNVDPEEVRSRILSHEFKGSTPWELSYGAKEMFALAVNLHAWPNSVCSAHVGIMVIHPEEEDD
jgi:hypothetical protein